MNFILKYSRGFFFFCSLFYFGLGATPVFAQTSEFNLQQLGEKTMLPARTISGKMPTLAIPEVCGDGTDTDSEECDMGSANSDTGPCTTSCTLAVCGDGLVFSAREECESTSTLAEHQTCTDCKIVTAEYCGDGIKNGNEECDGTDGLTDTAHQSCVSLLCKIETAEYCGDNIKNGSEECDGTDTTAGQTCASDCTFAATTDTTTDTTTTTEETTETTTDTTTTASTCGDGTVDTGEECDGTAGITDTTTQSCSSECKIVTTETSPCSDGSTQITVFCYGTEKATDGTNSGYCLNSAGDPAVEIKNFAAPKDFMPGLKALLWQDKNRIFRTDLAAGTTKRIQSSYSFTEITDLALGGAGILHIVDSGKVLTATKDGVSDLGLSVTVEKLVFDKDANKYLLTDDGKLYKADTSNALTELYDIKAERADFKAGGRMVLFKGSLYLSDLTAGKVLQYNITNDALSEWAEVTTPVNLAVRRSTGDLMVQNLTGSVIYKIALAETAAGQTATPEAYMEKVKSTGMAEVKICPSVTTIEPPCVASTEECDGKDNDCDGSVDEDLTEACYTGADGTENVGICAGGAKTCANGSWSDCSGETTPESSDTCDDGIDNDCDGTSDEGCVCADGDTQSCGSDEGECVAGTQTCANDAWSDECSGETTPTDETCDGKDNDCDGETDEGLTESCYTGASGTENVGICAGGTKTCTSGAWSDCSGETTPGSETCDELDNDCDGSIDEDCTGSGDSTASSSSGDDEEDGTADDTTSDSAESGEDDTVAAATDSTDDTTAEDGAEEDSTLTADDTTTSSGDSGSSEGEDEGGGGVKMVGGCLNMAGSAPIPASTASLVWLLLNFGALIGTRIKKKRAGRLDRSVPPS